MESESTQPPNVYVVGAQCTGKTTLIDALTKRFHISENRNWAGRTTSEPQVIKEVARKVLKKHNFTTADITSSPARALELQKLILEAQYHAEQTAAGSWYISDRSAMDPIVYAKVFVGEDAVLKMIQTEAWTQLREKMRKGLVFVCTPNPAWLYDDGVRTMPKDWDEWVSLHRTFCDSLKAQDVHFEILSAEMSVDERTNVILQRVLQLDRVPSGSTQEKSQDIECRGTNALL